jgi:hypothetical protein
MSFNTIIDPITHKIFDALIPEGGGVPLQKGQIITAIAGGTEVAFPVAPPADGSILSYDSNEATGLKYIANPAGIPLDYQQLISADATNNTSIVPAPLHNNYVLTSDTDPANATGLAWKAVGGSGVIQTNAPLDDAEVANVSTISINYTAVKGELPAGSGVAKVGVLVPAPAQDKWVLTSAVAEASGLKWAPPTGGGGIIDATAPLVDDTGVGTNTISINFSNAVGEIPYGTATKTGTLTNVPTAGQILGMAGNPAVPTWIDAGGSGTIKGTFPIVENAGGTNESIISINYSAGVKGEIPAGSGTLNTGVLLPPAKDASGQLVDGWGLQSLQSSPSGMVWVAPTANGTQSIYRSTTATTTVPPPTSTQDTLLLVAEEPNASWNLQVNPTDGTNTPYSIEFLSRTFDYQFDLPDDHLVVYVGEVVYINAVRCVQVSAVINYVGNKTTKILGHFHTEGYGSDAYVYCFCDPTTNPAGNDLFQVGPIVSGIFNAFHQTDGTEVVVANVAIINPLNVEQDNSITIQALGDPTLNTDIKGWVKYDQSISGGVVNKVFYDEDGADVILWIVGDFNAYQNGSGAGATYPLGWYSIAYYNVAYGGSASPYGQYGTTAQTVGTGYGVQISNNLAYPNNTPGFIADAWWSGAFQKLYIVGNWSYLTIDTASAFPAPANMGGFAVGNFTLPSGNKWVATPTGGAVPIPQAICLRPSVSQANNLIIANNASSNVLQFFNTTTGVFTVATGAVPVGQMRPFTNSIASGTIDIGFGPTAYDFVFYQDIVNLQTEAIWFSTPTLFVAQSLNPGITNVAPDYYPKPPPGNLSSLGIQLRTPSFEIAQPLQLQIAGKDGYYVYDPTTAGANLVFSGTFFKGGAGYSNANFSTTGLVLGGLSQSYIAQKGLKGWIQVGFETTGLTYS